MGPLILALMPNMVEPVAVAVLGLSIPATRVAREEAASTEAVEAGPGHLVAALREDGAAPGVPIPLGEAGLLGLQQ